MKTGRKLLCMLLIVCLFSALIPAAASASGGDEVTYKITVSGGNYGLVSGSKIYEETVRYGESLDIAKYISMVSYDTTADPSERYYFKSSFHYSGQTAAVTSGTSVTHDLILVADFGLKGEMRTVTVTYVEKPGGKVLHAPDEILAKVGDTIIIPCRHINGYTPNAYNYTWIVKEDDNTIPPFYYTLIPPPTTPTPQGPNNPATPINPANALRPQNPQNPAVVNPSNNSEQQNNGPVEVINLDNPDVPLAAPEPTEGTIASERETLKKRLRSAILLVVFSILLLLFALLFLFLRKKKKKDATDETET